MALGSILGIGGATNPLDAMIKKFDAENAGLKAHSSFGGLLSLDFLKNPSQNDTPLAGLANLGTQFTQGSGTSSKGNSDVLALLAGLGTLPGTSDQVNPLTAFLNQASENFGVNGRSRSQATASATTTATGAATETTTPSANSGIPPQTAAQGATATGQATATTGTQTRATAADNGLEGTFQQELGRTPTAEERQAFSGLTPQEIRLALANTPEAQVVKAYREVLLTDPTPEQRKAALDKVAADTAAKRPIQNTIETLKQELASTPAAQAIKIKKANIGAAAPATQAAPAVQAAPAAPAEERSEKKKDDAIDMSALNAQERAIAQAYMENRGKTSMEEIKQAAANTKDKPPEEAAKEVGKAFEAARAAGKEPPKPAKA